MGVLFLFFILIHGGNRRSPLMLNRCLYEKETTTFSRSFSIPCHFLVKENLSSCESHLWSQMLQYGSCNWIYLPESPLGYNSVKKCFPLFPLDPFQMAQNKREVNLKRGLAFDPCEIFSLLPKKQESYY